MEQNEITALIPYGDDAPTIEFTRPPAEEAYTKSQPRQDTVVTEPDGEAVRIPVREILRKLVTGFLLCVTVVTAGICAGHAAAAIAFETDSIPTLLLTALSAGDVRCTAVIPEIQKTTAADAPDAALSTVAPPEREPEEPAAQPNPLTFTNETPYTPDSAALLTRERAIPPLGSLTEDEPVVLILSTHATESYAEHAENGYRTTDDSENVIRTASVIAQILEETGIGVIHCRTRFDEEDFTMAYYNASLEIRAQLKEHPTIRYIIDVHRDSVAAADGTYLAMESGNLAQMMFVVGTDHGGSGHTGWEDNLALAARLHTSMEEEHPGLMRPVNLRSASFNQQYTPGSLILEIGSCAGSLENAVRSAGIFAHALADEIIG